MIGRLPVRDQQRIFAGWPRIAWSTNEISGMETGTGGRRVTKGEERRIEPTDCSKSPGRT